MIKFQTLLKGQSSMKVVLNGGHSELDDATIPFTIGFDESIAEKQPTHVLVIDFTYDQYKTYGYENDLDGLKRYYLSNIGERRIYELNKIDFIQFHNPGQHNLIFILFKDLEKYQKKNMIQKRSLQRSYKGHIHLNDIDDGTVTHNMVGYCEELVEIPEHFFAIKPESGFKKSWHSWVNRWFLTDPIDQCEFRKRAILALTIQPIAWFLGFLLRFVVSILVSCLAVAIHTLLFFSGQQLRYTLKNIGKMYLDFVMLYPKAGWKGVFDSDFWEDDHFEYKHYVAGKIKFRTPVSPLGLMIQVTLWFYYFQSLWMFWHSSFTDHSAEPIIFLFVSVGATILGVWHLALVVSTMPYEVVNKWRIKKFGKSNEESHRKVRRIIYCLMALSATCFVIAQVSWSEVLSGTINFLRSQLILISIVLLLIFLIFFNKKIGGIIKMSHSKLTLLVKWINNTPVAKWIEAGVDRIFTPKVVIEKPYGGTVTGDVTKRKFVKQTRTEWLKENMSIKHLPGKVDLKDVVAPTKTGKFVQKFKVGFWSTKSKVCKPYAK